MSEFLAHENISMGREKVLIAEHDERSDDTYATGSTLALTGTTRSRSYKKRPGVSGQQSSLRS